MKVDQELIKRVEDKILETFILAESKFGKTFELPKLSFDLNSDRMAGQAWGYENLIKINPKFLIDKTEEIISRTVPHEVAHLICDKIYPNAKQHHGPEWKSVMLKLGLPPIRCHNMILENSKFRHVYTCDCRKWNLSNIIHARIKKEYSLRRCPKCKGGLVYLNSRE